MFNSNYLRHGMTLGLASLVLFVVACESGDSGSQAADKEAGRANVDAMTKEHAGDTTDPSLAARIAPKRSVISERLPYAEVNDELVYGHFVFPSDMVDPMPAIIVIHEWWGLNDNIRAMADRLAGEGPPGICVRQYDSRRATDRLSGLVFWWWLVVEYGNAVSRGSGRYRYLLRSGD